MQDVVTGRGTGAGGVGEGEYDVTPSQYVVLSNRGQRQRGGLTDRNALGHLCDLGHDHHKAHPSIPAESESGRTPFGSSEKASSVISLFRSIDGLLPWTNVDQGIVYVSKHMMYTRKHLNHCHTVQPHKDSCGRGVYPTSILR